MSNSERLHSLLSDGKLHLSLHDTIALALENNLDISVARYQPAFAETDLLRAKSGGAAAVCKAHTPRRPYFRGRSEAASAAPSASSQFGQWGRAYGQWGSDQLRARLLL